MKPGNIVIISFIALALLIILSILFSVPQVEKDLMQKSKKALLEEGIRFENLEFDGQEAILRGVISSQEEKNQIEKIIAAVPGVSSVSNYLLAQTGVAVIVRVTGESTIIKAAGGQSIKAEIGIHVTDGDIITTGKNGGRTELKFLDDNSLLRIRPNSSCSINTIKENKSVSKNILLEFGSILAKIVQQKSVFKVTTSTSVAAVKGTSFWTLQEFKGATSFLGEEGVVEISNEAGVVLMKAGEMCSVISKDSKLIVEKIDLTKAFTTAVADNKISFDRNNSNLSQKHYEFLNKVNEFMNKYPNAILEISGYTDAVGSAKDNLKLSGQRANTIKDYLIELGVDPESIFAQGFGEQNPLATNYSREGRRKNRRVEFKVRENK